MPLGTHVTDRYSAQFIRNLTNPDNPSATTTDTARLDEAVTDAEADFQTYTGVVYDDTDNQHIALACEGVIATLKLRGASSRSGGEEAWAKWKERLDHAREMWGSNRRITPESTSVLTPASELDSSGRPVRPDYDRSMWHDMIPDSTREQEADRLVD